MAQAIQEAAGRRGPASVSGSRLQSRVRSRPPDRARWLLGPFRLRILPAGLRLLRTGDYRVLSGQAMASKCSRSPRACDTLTTVARLGLPSADSAL